MMGMSAVKSSSALLLLFCGFVTVTSGLTPSPSVSAMISCKEDYYDLQEKYSKEIVKFNDAHPDYSNACDEDLSLDFSQIICNYINFCTRSLRDDFNDLCANTMGGRPIVVDIVGSTPDSGEVIDPYIGYHASGKPYCFPQSCIQATYLHALPEIVVEMIHEEYPDYVQESFKTRRVDLVEDMSMECFILDSSSSNFFRPTWDADLEMSEFGIPLIKFKEGQIDRKFEDGSCISGWWDWPDETALIFAKDDVTNPNCLDAEFVWSEVKESWYQYETKNYPCNITTHPTLLELEDSDSFVSFSTDDQPEISMSEVFSEPNQSLLSASAMISCKEDYYDLQEKYSEDIAKFNHAHPDCSNACDEDLSPDFSFIECKYTNVCRADFNCFCANTMGGRPIVVEIDGFFANDDPGPYIYYGTEGKPYCFPQSCIQASYLHALPDIVEEMIHEEYPDYTNENFQVQPRNINLVEDMSMECFYDFDRMQYLGDSRISHQDGDLYMIERHDQKGDLEDYIDHWRYDGTPLIKFKKYEAYSYWQDCGIHERENIQTYIIFAKEDVINPKCLDAEFVWSEVKESWYQYDARNYPCITNPPVLLEVSSSFTPLATDDQPEISVSELPTVSPRAVSSKKFKKMKKNKDGKKSFKKSGKKTGKKLKMAKSGKKAKTKSGKKDKKMY